MRPMDRLSTTDDVVVILKEAPNEIGAQKPGAAGDQNAHQNTSDKLRMWVVTS